MQDELMLEGGVFPGSEMQSLPSQQLDTLQLVSLLRRRFAGEPFPHTFIHEGDAYAAAPADLVRGREHAPVTNIGSSKRIAWYFLSPANCHESAGGGSSAPRRKRSVGAGETLWHPETGKKPILGSDKKPLGAYEIMLSYVTKIRNHDHSGAGKSFKNKRLGWCMIEIGLEQHHGVPADQQLVLCKLYRTNRKHSEASLEASSAGVAALQVDQNPNPVSDDDPMPVQDAGFISEANKGGQKGHAEAEDASLGGAKLGTPCRPGGEHPSRMRELGIRCHTMRKAAAEETMPGFTVVMKFGESSIKSADRMKEMAKLVTGSCVVVLSAMGDTATNILLAAEKAVTCGEQKVCEIDELVVIKQLYLRTVDELGLHSSIVSGSLNELEQRLKYIAMTAELTPRARHGLVSLGESLATTIFSAYLNELGKKSRKYGAHGFRVITTDDSSNVDITEATYLAVAKELHGDWIDDPAIPIVNSFVKEGCKSGAITTLGSNLTAMIIGKALGSIEVQIWEDVDGVLTGDPNICTNAIPVPNLSFDEATELAYSGHQGLHLPSILLAIEGGLPVITVKNSYSPEAPGTTITPTRDMSKSILSNIVLRSNIVMLNILGTGVLSQHDFQAQVFLIFKHLQISVDHEATSGRNISLTLDLSKLSSPQLIQQMLDTVVEELEKVAVVVRQNKSIISLVGNVQRSSFILGKAFNALERIGVNVQKVSQRSSNSKVLNVSLVVHDSEAKRCVQVLHSAFLQDGCFLSKVEGAENEESTSLVDSSAAAANSGAKRKAADHDHLHARPAMLQRTDADRSRVVEETERTAFSDKAANLIGGGNLDCVMDAGVPQVQPEQPLSVDDYEVHNCFGIDVDDCNGGVPEVQPNEQVRAVPEVGEGSTVPVPEAVQTEKQVVAEAGEGTSGSPRVLENETEGSHHPMTDDGALENIRCRMLADHDPQTSAAEYYANAFQVDKGIEIEVDNFNGVVTQVQPKQVLAVPKVGDSSSVPEAVQPENETNADEALNDFLHTLDVTNIEPVRVDAGTGLAENVRRLFSKEEPMHIHGNNGEDPGGCLTCILEGDGNLDDAEALPVGGGEQAMPQSEPGAATEADAGQGFGTGDISTQVAPSVNGRQYVSACLFSFCM